MKLTKKEIQQRYIDNLLEVQALQPELFETPYKSLDDEFQKLANSDRTVGWSSSDWFKAGYEFCKRKEDNK